MLNSEVIISYIATEMQSEPYTHRLVVGVIAQLKSRSMLVQVEMINM